MVDFIIPVTWLPCLHTKQVPATPCWVFKNGTIYISQVHVDLQQWQRMNSTSLYQWTQRENSTSPIDKHIHTGNMITAWLWSFDLGIKVCQSTAIHCMFTKFDGDSSGWFPFRVQTHRQTQKVTDASDHSNYPSATASVGNGRLRVWDTKITEADNEENAEQR